MLNCPIEVNNCHLFFWKR